VHVPTVIRPPHFRVTSDHQAGDGGDHVGGEEGLLEVGTARRCDCLLKKREEEEEEEEEEGGGNYRSLYCLGSHSESW